MTLKSLKFFRILNASLWGPGIPQWHSDALGLQYLPAPLAGWYRLPVRPAQPTQGNEVMSSLGWGPAPEPPPSSLVSPHSDSLTLQRAQREGERRRWGRVATCA